MVYLIKCSLCECNYIFIPHRDFLISVWFVCLESVCHWECSWCAILKQCWPTVWLVSILDSLQFEDDAFPPFYIQYWYFHQKTMHQGTGEAWKEHCQVPVFWVSPWSFLFSTHQRLLIESEIHEICFLFFFCKFACFLSSVHKAFPLPLPPAMLQSCKNGGPFCGSPWVPSLTNTQTCKYGLLINWGCFHSVTQQQSPWSVLGAPARLWVYRDKSYSLIPWSCVLAEKADMERSNYRLAEQALQLRCEWRRVGGTMEASGNLWCPRQASWRRRWLWRWVLKRSPHIHKSSPIAQTRHKALNKINMAPAFILLGGSRY